MNLLKATGTIGGLTMVSRIAGFAREMLMSRVMGASWQAGRLLRRLPPCPTPSAPVRRGRLLGGFRAALQQRLHGEDGERKRRSSARKCSRFSRPPDLFTLVFEIIMGRSCSGSRLPRREARACDLPTRITFPYLLLISLVSLLSGILNSLARFTAAAFAPALLNLAMLSALIFMPIGGRTTAFALAVAVTLGGVLQLLLLLAACKRAGIVLKLRKPKITPGVRQFVRVVIPATLGAGVYQISALHRHVLPDAHRHRRDELFQLRRPPQSIAAGGIGAALGTAILPQVSMHVGANEPDKGCTRPGAGAELAMLLCLPPPCLWRLAHAARCRALFRAAIHR
jgi:putative peptidoglycan lipid II flippase